MAPHCNPVINVLQFSDSLGKSKLKRVAVTIWIGVVWTIWNLRNDVFDNGNFLLDRVATYLKIRV